MDNIMKQLKRWLKPVDKMFAKLQENVLGNIKQRRVFIDRGSKVLFIAHLDTVQKPKYIRQRKTKSGRLKRIYAQGLDDRLGCMLAFELSRELDADLLLTDYEECCMSTAIYHECKDYNWIVEFDRAGEDIVTYSIDSLDFRAALEDVWPIGFGSYSDIYDLKTDVCCFNLGIGYELAHSKDSYVDIEVMEKQIKLFKQFYAKYKDVEFKQDFINNDNDYWSEGETTDCCDICGMTGAEAFYGYFVCPDCFEGMMQEKVIVGEW